MGNSRPAVLNESRQRKWEAEESPLVEAVVRERHVKIQQAGKGLAGAVVNCKVWRLAVSLQLLVVPSGEYKEARNPFTNPYPLYRHTTKSVTMYMESNGVGNKAMNN
jgi:hypothetical protein